MEWELALHNDMIADSEHHTVVLQFIWDMWHKTKCLVEVCDKHMKTCYTLSSVSDRTTMSPIFSMFNKRHRGFDALLGHLQDRTSKLGLCLKATYVAEVTRQELM